MKIGRKSLVVVAAAALAGGVLAGPAHAETRLSAWANWMAGQGTVQFFCNAHVYEGVPSEIAVDSCTLLYDGVEVASSPSVVSGPVVAATLPTNWFGYEGGSHTVAVCVKAHAVVDGTTYLRDWCS
jgi:hypothetical protein